MKNVFSIQLIKKWIRNEYIRIKYYLNENKGDVIYLKSTDRQYGLTFLLEKRVLNENIPLLVPYEKDRIRMAHEMYHMGQLGFAKSCTEKYIYDELLVTPNTNTRGRKIPYILVDNACTSGDVERFLNFSIGTEIKNGFVTD